MTGGRKLGNCTLEILVGHAQEIVGAYILNLVLKVVLVSVVQKRTGAKGQKRTKRTESWRDGEWGWGARVCARGSTAF